MLQASVVGQSRQADPISPSSAEDDYNAEDESSKVRGSNQGDPVHTSYVSADEYFIARVTLGNYVVERVKKQ